MEFLVFVFERFLNLLVVDRFYFCGVWWIRVRSRGLSVRALGRFTWFRTSGGGYEGL